jgi:cation transport regulator ChaB
MPRKRKTTRDSLPSTLERSEDKAQDTFLATLESARETYDDERAAHRVAFAAVKHGYEKVGDHWEPKEEKGPSDPQAARGGARARRGGRTAGGVDANASKAHLMDVARRLDVKGRSKMTKEELVEALQRANDRETARARRES